MRCLVVVLLAAAAPAVPVSAQYQFDSWTTSEGLPQNSVQAILQARDGYLWLTTFDGLVRFDGVRFAVFNRANTPGINDNRFTALYEDADGVLWAGTEHDSLTRYDGRRFETFTLGGDGSGVIRGITGDDAGHLWLLRDDEVLAWRGDHVETVAAGFSRLPNVRSGVYARSGFAGFWTATEGGLTTFVDGATQAHSVPPRGRIDAVAKGPDGALWLAGDFGAAVARGGPFVVNHRAEECGAGRRQLLFSSRVTLACLDRTGRLMLIRLDSHERIVLGPPPVGVFADLVGVVFYEDREENLWVGNAVSGLQRARRHVVTTISQAEGLRDRNIYPVYQDRTGAIWLGAWMRTLSRIVGGRIDNFSSESGLPVDPVSAIFEDRDGRLWIGSIAGRQALRVRDGDRFVPPAGLDEVGGVKAIHQDVDGSMWFGTSTRLVHWHQGTLSSYTSKDGLAGNDVQVIVASAGGDLWFGGARGLSRLRHGAFTRYTEQDGLPGSHVRAIYEDADRVLWIGTYDSGLARFADGRFVRYTTREGLFDEGVFQILEDSVGRFWMSSNRGIYRVSRGELNDVAAGRRSTITAVGYGRSDGMRSIEANGGSWPAGMKAHDGTLWFPTQDGVVVVDTRRLPPAAEPPPVRIEACRLDRHPASIDAPIRVPPGSSNLEIDYTALTFVNSPRVRFRYRLDGLQDEWVEAGTRRTAYYSALPPGRYRFTVVAASSDGVWNSAGDRLDVIVLPPFYRTWWFLFMSATSGVALVVLGAKRREAGLRRGHALQQAFSRQLIASQEAERQRIAAELHDSIGQSLVFIRNLAQLAERARGDRADSHVARISAEAAHAIAEVQMIARDLRPPHLDRLGLTRSLEVLVEKAAAVSGIRFAADIDDLAGVFPKDAEITVYRVVQEGINNILKHSRASEAAVAVQVLDTQVQLSLRDNGDGFVPAGPDGSSGFGLTGLTERVRVLGGRTDIRSARGQGTTIGVVFHRARTDHGQ